MVFVNNHQNITSLNNLTHIKGKHILNDLLKIFQGFQLLFGKFGPFRITADMIAFDSFFDPFVWMNS